MNLQKSIVAGVSVALVGLPQGLSFAVVAGLPAVYGLYNSLVPSLVYSALGSSPYMIVGPTAVLALMTRTSIPADVEEDSEEWVAHAVALSLISGAVLLTMGVMKLGVFLRLVSEPVLAGFINASAIVMIGNQLASLLGVPKCNAADLWGEGHEMDECFLQETLYSIYHHASDIHQTTVVCSLMALAVLLSFKLVRHDTLRSLGPLAVSCVSLGVFYYLGHHYGMTEDEKGRHFDAKLKVRLIGPVPKGLPHPQLPLAHYHLRSFHRIMKMLPAALVMAVVGFMESMAISSSLHRKAAMTRSKSVTEEGAALHPRAAAEEEEEEEKEDPPINPTKELFALGFANVVGAFFRCFPITGSFSRSALNQDAGSRSQLSALVSSGVIASVLLFLTPVVQYMPRFALAAIVVVSVLGLLDMGEFFFLRRTSPADALAFTLVIVVICTAGFERGLAVGCVASIISTTMHARPMRLNLLRRARGGKNLLSFPATTSSSIGTGAATSSSSSSSSVVVLLDPSAVAVEFEDVVAALHRQLDVEDAGGISVASSGEGNALLAVPLVSSDLATNKGHKSHLTMVTDVAVLRLDAGLIFSCVDQLNLAVDRLRGAFRPGVLAVDLSACPTIDASGLRALDAVARSLSASTGGHSGNPLLLCDPNPGVRRMIERARAADTELCDAWNTSPRVGGVSLAKPPRVLAFPSLRDALRWVSYFEEDFFPAAEASAQGQGARVGWTLEGRAMAMRAALTSWRSDDASPDQDPACCRIPSFARGEDDAFEVVEWQ